MKKLAVIVFSISIFLSGCEKIPSYLQSKLGKSKKGEKERSQVKSKKKKSKKKRKTSKVGVSNVIDYGTGYTPLKIKQKKKKSVNEINRKHNEKLKKALNAY